MDTLEKPMIDNESTESLPTAAGSWSVTAGEFDPKKNPPQLSDLKSIESDIKYIPDEAKARARAAHILIYALELVSPELFEDPERARDIQKEIGKASMVVADYVGTQWTELRESTHGESLEEAPVIKAIEYMISRGMIKGGTHRLSMGIARYKFKEQLEKQQSENS